MLISAMTRSVRELRSSRMRCAVLGLSSSGQVTSYPAAQSSSRSRRTSSPSSDLGCEHSALLVAGGMLACGVRSLSW